MSRKSNRRGRPSITDEQRLEMREKIASITLKLFIESGYRNISMRKIAENVGCSAMTLYKYYDSKVAILYTLWSVVFDELENELLHKNKNAASLEKLSTTYVEYWINHSDNYRLVYMTEGVEQSDVDVFLEAPEIAEKYSLFLNGIEEATDQALSEKELQDRLGALICFLNGITHNLITISGYPWPSTNYLVKLAVDAIVKN